MRRIFCAYFFGMGLGVLLSGMLAISVARINTEPEQILHSKSAGQLDLVADFGADPTGRADIVNALKAAIATGKPIFIPAGTYLLSGGISDRSANPVTLECAGPTVTTINVSGIQNFKNPVTISDCGFFITDPKELSWSGF